MCIRDRVEVAEQRRDHTALRNALLARCLENQSQQSHHVIVVHPERHFVEQQVMPHGVKAVSYTHLDVYKRQVKASDCIALEDSDNGLRAALAAGIRTYITRNAYTRGHRFEGAAAVFEDLSDLPGFCRQAGLLLPGVSD